MILAKDVVCKDVDLPDGNLILQEQGSSTPEVEWIPNISASKLSLLREQDFFKSLVNGDHCKDMRDHIILIGSQQSISDHWLQASKFLMEIVELHVDIKELLQGTFTPRLEQINCAIQVLLPIRAEKCIHHVPGNDCLLLVHHNSLSCRRVFHSIFCDLLKMQIQFPI